jgi:FtsZ-binding cell division protein ZapB
MADLEKLAEELKESSESLEAEPSVIEGEIPAEVQPPAEVKTEQKSLDDKLDEPLRKLEEISEER